MQSTTNFINLMQPQTLFSQTNCGWGNSSSIRQLDSTKSSGTDGIPIKYVKMSATIITLILTNLYNHCITKGIFPGLLKIAEVIPIYKKGPKEICSNYSPILLLSPFTKLFEKCIHEQLSLFFESNQLFSPDQFGFLKKCSTSDAVLDIYTQLVDNLDKLITCSVFLDLAKAYNTTDHKILLKKLEAYGIRGLPLQLMGSYLNKTKQFTVINHTKSNLMHILCGISQGLILRPLLFNIYTNDLPLASKSNIHLFANDTNLTCSHTNPKFIENCKWRITKYMWSDAFE